MEKYNIVVNPEAEDDLDDIIDYLATLSEQAAVKYYDLIIEKINDLSEIPERCPLMKDTQLQLRGYRTMQVKNYIVFYVIISKTVEIEIRRILHSRRRYERLL